MIFTRVDFPAPFSPNNAWIWEDLTFMEISLFALTDPNSLFIAMHLNREFLILLLNLPVFQLGRFK